MEPKGKNVNRSGTITKTCELGIPSTEPVNGHVISTVTCPT